MFAVNLLLVRAAQSNMKNRFLKAVLFFWGVFPPRKVNSAKSSDSTLGASESNGLELL